MTAGTAETLSRDDILSLVRDDYVHRRAYADPDVFALEQERIFGRLWIYVAHESQLAKPGDFVRTHLGMHEVLVTRHHDGTVHVLHNRCPHRGARLCMVERGHTRLLTCPYHAWAFRADGTLSAVPHPQSYPSSFRLDDPLNHMQRIKNVQSYRGFIFASQSNDPSPLTEHLGGMAEVIDNLIDRAPDGEVEVADSSFTLEYDGNWKLHMENANDVFHPSFVHSSSVAPARAAPPNASIIDQDQTREMLLANGFGTTEWEGIQLNGSARGHTYMSSFYKKGVIASEPQDAASVAYRAALTARHGAQRAATVLGMTRFNNIIYPNLIINAQQQHMRVTVPLAVDRTQVRVHCFRLKGAPDEIFHRAIRFLTNIGSPASMIFSDDVEMLERCQQGLVKNAGPWLNFSRGLDNDRRNGDGSVGGAASELPMRVQFDAWVKYLTQ
jgi:phenylpropionate dioxygenase-like ring-hydroxylating dioxygenase large terminal subunit